MCLYQREIVNGQTHQHFFAKCGKCPSCLQEKALRRTVKIQDHYNPAIHKHPIFLTLTYHTDYVPYIYQDDFDAWINGDMLEVPVYREHDVYITTKKGETIKTDHGLKLLGTFSADSLSTDSYQFNFDDLDLENPVNKVLPKLHKKAKGHHVTDPYGRVGVLWSDEIPKFFKRLRSKLERKYHVNTKFSYYYVGEYGGQYHRPHWHIVIYFDAPISFEDWQRFALACHEAWPFQVWNKLPRSLEQALSPASYLGSYISRDQLLPSIFYINSSFRPCARHSLGFGFGRSEFSRTEIEKKIDDGALTICRNINKDGVPTDVYLPIPTYVVHRYYPKFKGYSRCSFDEIYNLLRLSYHYAKVGVYAFDSDPFEMTPEQSYHKAQIDQLLPFLSRIKDKLEWVEEDVNLILKRLRNIIIRENIDDISSYAWYYYRAWQVRMNTIHNADYLSIQHEDVISQFTHYYNTLQFVYNEIWMNPLCKLPDSAFYKVFQHWHGQHPNFQLNANLYPCNIQKTAKLQDIYYKYRKNRLTSEFSLKNG